MITRHNPDGNTDGGSGNFFPPLEVKHLVFLRNAEGAAFADTPNSFFNPQDYQVLHFQRRKEVPRIPENHPIPYGRNRFTITVRRRQIVALLTEPFVLVLLPPTVSAVRPLPI